MSDPKPVGSNNPIRRMSRRYWMWAAYGLLMVMMVIIQSLPHGIPAIGGVRPVLVVPLVVCIAMYEGPIDGAAAGIASGLLWDMFSDRLLGFNALLLLIVGCACGLLVRLLIRNNLLSAFLLVAGGLLVTGFSDWFFNHVMALQKEAGLALVQYTLPRMGYSLLMTPFLYGLVTLAARTVRRYTGT